MIKKEFLLSSQATHGVFCSKEKVVPDVLFSHQKVTVTDVNVFYTLHTVSDNQLKELAK